MLKLHLGCGKRYIPGYVHIDMIDLPHIDYERDISDLSIFEDEKVDLIYCSHAFEYFDRIQAKTVLNEWNRVLKPDGILRLAVPDFESLAKVYIKEKELSLIHGPLYGRIEVVKDGQRMVAYHKTVYDFESLKRVLAESGFTDIHRYNWQETEHKDYDDFSQAYIPHMDKKRGILISLNVEATKSKKISEKNGHE